MEHNNHFKLVGIITNHFLQAKDIFLDYFVRVDMHKDIMFILVTTFLIVLSVTIMA